MAAPTATGATAAQGSKPVIGVVFYSMYGHIATLAEEVIAGVEAAGAIAKPFFIEETLPATVLEKMHAGASLKPKYPLVTPQDLVELDGFIFGIPTRYGRAPAQVSAFFDKTGGLWAQQALAGKYVGTFTSTASQHGGQELTHLTTMPFWAHHGCIYVPIGYKAPYLQNNEEVHGGSPWGVSTVANGDGSRVPTKGELEVARWQGEHFAGIVAAAVRGRHLLAADRSGSSGTAAGVAAGAGAAGVAGAGAAAAAGSGAGQQPQTGAARTEAPLASTAPDSAAAQQLAKEPTGPAAPTSAEAVGNAPTGTTGTGNAPAGTEGGVGAAAAGVAGAGAGAVAAGGEKTTPAPATAGATGTGATPATGAAGARPTATAPQKKSGGLFSCCSGNSIE